MVTNIFFLRHGIHDACGGIIFFFYFLTKIFDVYERRESWSRNRHAISYIIIRSGDEAGGSDDVMRR